MSKQRDCMKLRGISEARFVELFGADMKAEKVSVEYMKEKQANQALKMQRLEVDEEIDANIARMIGESDDPLTVLNALVHRDRTESIGVVSLDNRVQAIRGLVKTELADHMEFFAPKMGDMLSSSIKGKRRFSAEQKQVLDDAIDIIYGGKVDNPKAQEFADAYRSAKQTMVERFGRAGGDVRNFRTNHIPQPTDVKKAVDMGIDNYIKMVYNLIDLERVKKSMRVKDPTKADVEQALADSYTKLTIRPKDDATSMGDMLLNERFLHFKSGKAHREYQEALGSDNMFGSLMEEFDTFSRHIGAMEVFGSNPAVGFKKARKEAEKQAKLNKYKTVNKVKSGEKSKWKSYIEANFTGSSGHAERTFDLITGRSAIDPAMLSTMEGMTASVISGMKDIRVASKLGGAVLPATSDAIHLMDGALYNGLSTVDVVKSLVANQVKALSKVAGKKGGTGGVRKEISDLGMGMDYALDRSMISYDYILTGGNARTRSMAELGSTVSGLSGWTSVAKATGQMEFNLGFTRMIKDGVDNPKLLGTLQRYGFSAEDLANLKKAPTTKLANGEEVIDPAKLLKTHEDLATRYVGVVDAELSILVPTPDASVKAFLLMGTKNGSAPSEILSAVTQFQSFNTTMLMNNIGRMVYGNGTPLTKVGHLAGMIATTTALASGTTQIKEMLKGNTPHDWDSPVLWTKAVAQGGMLPIVADFYATQILGGRTEAIQRQLGGGITEFLDFGADMMAWDGTEKGMDKLNKATKYIISNVPLQNLWYTKPVIDNTLKAWLDEMTSSDSIYKQRQQRKLKRMEESGQEKWWNNN